MSKLRSRVKDLVPAPVRKLLRAGLHYIQRLGRWPILLVQVQGDTFPDQVKLLLSALASPVIAMRNLLEWQDPVPLFDMVVRVRGVGRFMIRGHTDDLWHVMPWREKEIFKQIRRTLRPGMVFVDAGANIGIYSVLASKLVNDDGQIFAIEMVPDTAAILKDHLKMNHCGNVRIIRGALSNAPGETVVATIPFRKYGQASIAERVHNASLESIEIQTVSLDRILDNVPRVDLMKMDLEGAEPEVLDGAKAVLERISIIIYEAHNNVVEDIEDRLADAGFVVNGLTAKDRMATRRAGKNGGA